MIGRVSVPSKMRGYSTLDGIVRVTAIRGRVGGQGLSQAMIYAVRARHAANAAVRLCL